MQRGGVELRTAALEAAHRRQGRAEQERQERDHEVVEEAADPGHGLADRRGLVLDGVAEERTADDRERDAHHLLGHVDGLAVVPAVPQPCRFADHDVAVGGHAAPVEGRLDHAAVAQVEVTLRGQQPLAEHDLRALEARAPS